MKNYKYLFGPVPSRRFRRSLGVDLTPYKTCSLDCVFCQLGRTVKKTISREEYVPIEEVLLELGEWLESGGQADYITLSGSGEPTLHSRFGDVLEFVRKKSTIPAALLTNATLLSIPEVREAARIANVVKVSLSAWDQASFEWMNRPHPELVFEEVVQGQKAFREMFKGSLWMEVFIVRGINSSPKDVEKIARFAREIRPDRIHLNTVVRPPAESFATAPSRTQLEELCPLFHPKAEVIAEFDSSLTTNVKVNEDMIFTMLQRRPCTAQDIAEIFGLHINEVSKYLGKLLRKDLIRARRNEEGVYYTKTITEEKADANL